MRRGRPRSWPHVTSQPRSRNRAPDLAPGLWITSVGWSRDTIKFRARSWRRILKGVYLLDGRAVDEDVLGMAALLRWPETVLSHEIAARRRGWKLLDQRPNWHAWLPDEPNGEQVVHLTGTKQFRVQEGFRLHRAEPGDFSLIGAARVTDEVRTLVDIARTAALPVSVRVIDAVCRVDLSLLHDLRTELAHLSGQRGVHRAQRACRLAHQVLSPCSNRCCDCYLHSRACRRQGFRSRCGIPAVPTSAISDIQTSSGSSRPMAGQALAAHESR